MNADDIAKLPTPLTDAAYARSSDNTADGWKLASDFERDRAALIAEFSLVLRNEPARRFPSARETLAAIAQREKEIANG